MKKLSKEEGVAVAISIVIVLVLFLVGSFYQRFLYDSGPGPDNRENTVNGQ